MPLTSPTSPGTSLLRQSQNIQSRQTQASGLPSAPRNPSARFSGLANQGVNIAQQRQNFGGLVGIGVGQAASHLDPRTRSLTAQGNVIDRQRAEADQFRSDQLQADLSQFLAEQAFFGTPESLEFQNQRDDLFQQLAFASDPTNFKRARKDFLTGKKADLAALEDQRADAQDDILLARAALGDIEAQRALAGERRDAAIRQAKRSQRENTRANRDTAAASGSFFGAGRGRRDRSLAQDFRDNRDEAQRSFRSRQLELNAQKRNTEARIRSANRLTERLNVTESQLRSAMRDGLRQLKLGYSGAEDDILASLEGVNGAEAQAQATFVMQNIMDIQQQIPFGSQIQNQQLLAAGLPTAQGFQQLQDAGITLDEFQQQLASGFGV